MHLDLQSAHQYYKNHILLEKSSEGTGPNGSYAIYDCILSGDCVGTINYRKRPSKPWEKPFSLSIRNPCQPKRMNYVGAYNSLIEAKASALAEAQKMLAEEAKRQAEQKNKTFSCTFLPETDHQFYPTPSDLAGKLLANVDWDHVKTILEPSAGRGDLVEWAKCLCKNTKVFGQSFERELESVDCVEIDPNLRAILIGKGHRVVHDDFLTYHTRKQYDLILMNPPFAQGDLHLLHALELCASGGQIACILNAETLRNPFTNSRKLLVKELRKHNASIRYVKKGFSRAARKTDVDIALVNVNIPRAFSDTAIWDSLKKAQDESISPEAPNELAPSNQVERLIREYNLLCEAGIQMMRVYNGVSNRIMCSSKRDYAHPILCLTVDGSKADQCGPSHVNQFLQAARARYWRELFDLPELRQRMTSAMLDEYHSTIERMKDYEFSMFNIRQVIEQIMGQIVTGVEDAIIKCFDKLSAEHSFHSDVQNENIHYYNGWKTNKAHYVNAKCIIPTYGCFARGYKPDKHGRYKDTLEGLDVRGCFQVLDDLEKALDYLDKGETPASNLGQMLQYAASAGKTTVACKYFTVTFYKKGTCHIKFHDQKIVDRLNIYVGRQRAWLPPAYGSVRYDQMDDESKRVVDEFQGREKYAAVINAPNDYLIDTKAAPLLLS